MKKLTLLLIALIVVSCSKDDSTNEPTTQDHWKVNYRSECDGEISGFLHVSDVEWNRAQQTPYYINENGCVKYRIKDMSGNFEFYFYHSAIRPCDEH